MRTVKLSMFPLFISASLLSQPAIAEPTDIEQFIQQVINHYPAIKTAYLEVASAEQEKIKVYGQTAWQLGASAAYNQEVSLFGSPVKQTLLGASLGRQLESGDRIAFSAQLSHEDADESTIPTLPNPSTSSALKFEYTKPLGKGADNIELRVGIDNAKAGVDLKQSARQQLLDDMASKIIDLFFSAASTQLRIKNTEDAIARTHQLVRFVNKRLKLGIVETKDELQTEAQLKSQQAQLSSLQLAWTQQQIAINRLTGQDWNNKLELALPKQSASHLDEKTLYQKILSYSPSVRQLDTLITLAENQIDLARQQQKDQLDLKLYVGNKTSEGDTVSGSINNSDVVAGVALDYHQNLDRSASNAALYQAQLQRGTQLQQKKLLMDNLWFDIASLVAEIRANQNIIKAYKNSYKAELEKLQDAEKRYRDGRIDIDQLLSFENQLAATDLTLKLETMNLQHRLLRLTLLQGNIWKNITLPVYDFETDELINNENLNGENS